MKFIKILVVVFSVLWAGHSYASSDCNTTKPFMETYDEYQKRIQKYDASQLMQADYIEDFLVYSQNSHTKCDKKPRIIHYNITKHRGKHKLNKSQYILNEQEQKNIITILTIITDDRKKAHHIFGAYYKNYLDEYEKQTEQCANAKTINQCYLNVSFQVDDFKIVTQGIMSYKSGTMTSSVIPVFFQVRHQEQEKAGNEK